MTSAELLDFLTKHALVDDRTLGKLRREVEMPGKKIKAGKILAYLIEKGALTSDQGHAILHGTWTPPTEIVPDDQFEISVEAESGAKVYDTDDLTNIGAEIVKESQQKTKPADENMTRIMDPQDAIDVVPEEVEEIEEVVDVDAVVEEFAKPTRRKREVDPFADYGASDSGGFATAQAAENHGSPFAGKRDQTDQWKTKWLFIGSGALAILLIIGAALALSVFQREPSKLFAAAEESYVKSTYGDAMAKFKDFYKRFPGDDKVSHAKVREVQSMIWLPYSSNNLSEAYKVALEKIPTIEDEPEIGLITTDYSIWFPKIVLDFSEKAMKETTIEGMKTALAKAEESLQLLNFMTQAEKNSERVKPELDKTENNLLTVKGLITKEESYNAALVEIADLATAGKTNEAFAKYNRLTRTYRDLAARQPLRDLMKTVTAREIDLVKPIERTLASIPTDVETAVSQTIMLSSKRGQAAPSIQDELIPLLIEGYVYVLSGSDGNILWSRFVGYQTTIAPIWFDAVTREALLVCDELNNQVMRIDARTGGLVWRTEIGEAYVAPTLRDNRIFVPARSGAVYRLDPNSGEQKAACQLPKSIVVPCEAAEQDPYVYVVGEDSNIYVLNAEDLKCVEAYYLGHARNDIQIAPIYWSGHLIVSINGRNFSDLQILRLTNNGTGLQFVQLVRLANSAISRQPIHLGRNLLFISDKGEINLTELVATEVDAPMIKTGEVKLEVSNRPYFAAQGSGLWVVGRGIQTLRVNKNSGEFERKSIKDDSDTFLNSPIIFENIMVHVRRRSGSGAVSVTAANLETLEEIWRRDFGAPLAGALVQAGDGAKAISSQGDLFDIGSSESKFTSLSETTKASDIDTPFVFSGLVPLSENRVAAIGSVGSADLLIADTASDRLQVTRMMFKSDPAMRAADPVTIGSDFIVPTLNGLVLRFDQDGRALNAPFAPPMEPGDSIKWTNPVGNANSQVMLADDKQKIYLLDGSDRNSLTLVNTMTFEGKIKSKLVASDEAAFVVIDTSGSASLRKLSFENPIAEVAKASCSSGVVSGPYLVGDKVLMHLDDGKFYAWDLDLKPVWQVDVGNERIASIFVNGNGSSTFIVFESGLIASVDGTGSLNQVQNLGQAVRNNPLFVGEDIYFSAANGSVLVVKRSDFQ